MKTVILPAALAAAFALPAWGHSAPPVTGQIAVNNWPLGENHYPMPSQTSDPELEDIAQPDAQLNRDRLFSQVDKGLGNRLEAQLKLAIDVRGSGAREGVSTN